MLKRASVHGGHFGPDFGIVDKIVADLIQIKKIINTLKIYGLRIPRCFVLWRRGLKQGTGRYGGIGVLFVSRGLHGWN